MLTRCDLGHEPRELARYAGRTGMRLRTVATGTPCAGRNMSVGYGGRGKTTLTLGPHAKGD